MKKKSLLIVISFVLFSTLAKLAWAQYTSFFCEEDSTVIANFLPGTLPFPDGTNITNQFKQQGLIFSADDGDLPPEFQASLGTQENIIISGTFFNLFRLNFLPSTKRPVVSVTVTLGNHNGVFQTHTLTAFDSSGTVVDAASFTQKVQARTLIRSP
jgi:hypothetical protein